MLIFVAVDIAVAAKTPPEAFIIELAMYAAGAPVNVTSALTIHTPSPLGVNNVTGVAVGVDAVSPAAVVNDGAMIVLLDTT